MGRYHAADSASEETKTRNSLIVYLGLTFGLSSIFHARSFSGAPLAEVTPLLMWMPAGAAIVAMWQVET